MPKKPYVKKKEAVTYHLIHQSIRDEGTDNPHKMFLHEVQPPNMKEWKKDDARSQVSARSKQSARSARTISGISHRDDESVGTSVVSMGRFRQDDFAFGEYGFEDDGYDYTQHFRPRGNGRFVPAIPLSPAALNGGPAAANGGLTKQSLAQLLDETKGPELPKELFGNETFSAKTRLDFTAEDDLPPELVPAEIDELLAAEEDPKKEDELEDDFVILADGGEGFDEFDNPDDDEVGDEDDLPELEKPTRELHLDAEGKLRDQDGNEVDEPFGEDDLDGEAIERIERPVRAAATGKGKAGRRRVPLPLPTEPAKPTLIDKRFDAVARAYADEEIGELEEDERTRGGADISEFESVLDEFLLSKDKDRIRVALPKKAAAANGDHEEGDGDEGEEGDEGELEDDGDSGFEEEDDGEEEEEEEEEEAPKARGSKPKPLAPAAPKKAAAVASNGSAAKVAPETEKPAAPPAPSAGSAEPAAKEPKEPKKPAAMVVRHQENEEEDSEEEEEFEVIELRERANWDCESIVSTYSNTENHPSLIADPGKRIQLSRKTGMPLGVLPTKPKKAPAVAEPRENLGAPRRKQESAEEKKARKAAVKEARRQARERSKQLGGAFKEEERTQLNATRGQPMGRSVIRMD